MSKACKCDKCGEYYDITAAIPARIYSVVVSKHPYDDVYLDLCTNCYEKLCEFLKGQLQV